MIHELKLVIEFAPGDVIFLPSSLFTHWNCPLGNPQKETRYSVTSFTAGGLFQLRDQGFFTKAHIRRQIQAEKARMVKTGDMDDREVRRLEAMIDSQEQANVRWEKGWDVFLTRAQLQARVDQTIGRGEEDMDISD